MKVLLVNGSPHMQGCTFTALAEVENKLKEEGIETEMHWIGKGDTPGCRSCRQCRHAGYCVLGDDVADVGRRLGEFEGYVFGAPVYYSGVAGQMSAWMDRLFFSAGGRMAGKPAAAVVSCRRAGATASLERFNQYFLINNMLVVGSQYWNEVHGNSPEEVARDLEGLQIMRTLAQNMAWTLKCIAAGRKEGMQHPEHEPKVMTNFIRRSIPATPSPGRTC